MSGEYPKHFYKYRAVYPNNKPELTNEEKLKDDIALVNLLNYQAVFSSRQNFNDLFDCKIDIIDPSPQDIEALIPFILANAKDYKPLNRTNNDSKFREFDKLNKSLLAERAYECRAMVHHGKFTNRGTKLLDSLKGTLTNLLDKYSFICLSSNPKSNLMWSHYADSHRGFCIEFKSEYIKADKVEYQETLPKMYLLDYCKSYFGLVGGEHLGNLIWGALRTKLTEWEYESEYRFQPDNKTAKPFVEGKYYYLLDYPEYFVESIIFGHRMPQYIKDHIIKNTPAGTKFKQAYPALSTIEIKDY